MLRLALPTVLLPLLAVPTDLAFAPAADSTWTTSIDLERTVSGGELTVIMGGEEVPSMFLPKLELNNKESLQLIVRDSVEVAGDDGSLTLLRRFEKARREERGRFINAGEEADTWNEISDSPAAGRVVQFEREEADGEFSVSLGDDEAPIVIMSELSAHLPGSELLPDDEVEVGDSWTISDEHVKSLLAPGGNLGFPGRDGEEAPEREFGGRIVLTLDSLDEAGLATISLEGTLTESSSEETDLDDVPVTDGTATETTTWDIEIEGTMSWDSAKGHCRSISVEGSGNYSVNAVRDPSLQGATYESDFVMDANYGFELSTNAAPKAAEAGASK